MFRFLFSRPRSIRLPVQNGTVDIQRVSVTTRRRPMVFRLAGSLMVGYVAVTVAGTAYTLYTGVPLFKGRSVKDADTIERIIPFMIRRTQRPLQLTDPEWKAAEALQQDEKRSDAVKLQVWKQVYQRLKENPVHQAQLRAIQWQPQPQPGASSVRVSLDLDVCPPIYAAPFYEVAYAVYRRDNAWESQTIEWRRVNPVMAAKLDRIYHPWYLAQAFYKGAHQFVVLTYLVTKARVADYLNPNSAQPPSPQTISRIQNILSEEQKLVQRYAITRAREADKKRGLPFLYGDFGEHASRRDYRDLVKSLTYAVALDHACATFRFTWLKGKHDAEQRDALGSVVIAGHIDCEGNIGTYRLEVAALYSPETDSLIGHPLIKNHYVIRDLAATRQAVLAHLEEKNKQRRRAQHVQQQYAQLRQRQHETRQSQSQSPPPPPSPTQQQEMTQPQSQTQTQTRQDSSAIQPPLKQSPEPSQSPNPRPETETKDEHDDHDHDNDEDNK